MFKHKITPVHKVCSWSLKFHDEMYEQLLLSTLLY